MLSVHCIEIKSKIKCATILNKHLQCISGCANSTTCIDSMDSVNSMKQVKTAP